MNDAFEERIKLSMGLLFAAARLGFREDQFQSLFDTTTIHCFFTRKPYYSYDCLQNRELWHENPHLIPAQHQRNWLIDTALSDRMNISIVGVGEHSDRAMGRALDRLGTWLIDYAEKHDKPHLYGQGCFVLQVGVLFGDEQAAVHLMNFTKDPLLTEKATSDGLQLDTHAALKLITELATTDPDTCDDMIMLTFVDNEFSPRKIALQKPSQLQWGLDRLSSIPDIYQDIIDDQKPCDKFQHPARIRLRIIEHCMAKRISLEKYPLADMPELRASALVDLAGINDPQASMIVACQPGGPAYFSQEWQHLITVAAAGGIGPALWLLGVHHMRMEGILPVKTNAKRDLEESLGFEFARLAIFAMHDQPSWMLAYTLGLVALCRSVGDTARALAIINESEKDADSNPNFPQDVYRKLTGHLDDLLDEKWNLDGKQSRLLSELFEIESPQLQVSMAPFRAAGASP